MPSLRRSYRHLARTTFVGLIVMSCWSAAAAAGPRPVQTPARRAIAELPAHSVVDTLWRGVLAGDSIYVRGGWVPTCGAESCDGEKGYTLGDSAAIEPKFVYYDVVNAKGAVLKRGGMSDYHIDASTDPERSYCCDRFSAQGAPWKGGLVVAISAYELPCEPAGGCTDHRYFWLRGHGLSASSEWDLLEWDPASSDSVDGWWGENCITYNTRLQPVVRDSTIEFEPWLSPTARPGDRLTMSLSDYTDCARDSVAADSVAIDLYPTAESDRAHIVRILANDEIEFASAVLQLIEVDGGALVRKIVRLEVAVAGHRGFMTLEALKRLGFAYL